MASSDHAETQPKTDDLKPKFPFNRNLEDSWTSWLYNEDFCFPRNTSQVVVDDHVIKRYYTNGIEDKIVCPFKTFDMVVENFANTINGFVTRLDEAALKKKEVEKKNVVDQSGQESYEKSCTEESKNDEAKCLGSLHNEDCNAPLKKELEEQKIKVTNQSIEDECHGCLYYYENNHTDRSENANKRCCYKDW